MRRFGALSHEAFFLTAFIFIAELAVTRLAGGELKGTWRHISQAVLFVGIGAYFIWQWTHNRRTLAQKTWALRLRDAASGGAVPLQSAIKRYIAAWLGPALALLAYVTIGKIGLWLILVNVLWSFFDRDGQFLHDRLAGTRLLHEPEQSR